MFYIVKAANMKSGDGSSCLFTLDNHRDKLSISRWGLKLQQRFEIEKNITKQLKKRLKIDVRYAT
jgi:hypothetical protein